MRGRCSGAGDLERICEVVENIRINLICISINLIDRDLLCFPDRKDRADPQTDDRSVHSLSPNSKIPIPFLLKDFSPQANASQPPYSQIPPAVHQYYPVHLRRDATAASPVTEHLMLQDLRFTLSFFLRAPAHTHIALCCFSGSTSTLICTNLVNHLKPFGHHDHAYLSLPSTTDHQTQGLVDPAIHRNTSLSSLLCSFVVSMSHLTLHVSLIIHYFQQALLQHSFSSLLISAGESLDPLNFHYPAFDICQLRLQSSNICRSITPPS